MTASAKLCQEMEMGGWLYMNKALQVTHSINRTRNAELRKRAAKRSNGRVACLW
jgi:hypothetical protein